MTLENIFYESAIANTPASLKNKRCLIVEDNKHNQALFTKALTDEKVITRLAGNGKEALDLIEATDFDFVVMDLQMPVMDGFETLAAIRERSDEKRNLKVIVVTAFNVENIRSQCLIIGFDEFMHKPFQPGELISAIKRMLYEELSEDEIIQKEKTDFHRHTSHEDRAMQINLSYLKSFAKGDAEFEKDILETSLNEIEHNILSLKKLITPPDLKKISEHAHTLKSLFAITGVNALHQQFAAIEKGAIEEMNVLSIEVYIKLMAHWQNIKASLEKILKTM